MTVQLSDLLKMTSQDLYAIVDRGEPLDVEALADTSYTGVDLSMPDWFHKLMWRSFRKTFHKDPVSGRLRGWNVKVEQTGWDTPPEPKRDGKGKALTFGHYEVLPAAGLRFPRGWQGGHYLDYRHAGNHWWDWPARRGYCPLVSVNAGSSELLLGWEIFNVAGLMVPITDFWALKREGRLAAEDVLPRPNGSVPKGPDS